MLLVINCEIVQCCYLCSTPGVGAIDNQRRATRVYFNSSLLIGEFMMSANNISERDTKDTIMLHCASCGTAEVDDIKLKTCTACKSVRYCSVTCQRNHRPKHKKACKKRAAELRDELLFRQPEGTHHGDCPICFLPLALCPSKSMYYSCCSKIVCKGCDYAHELHQMNERLERTCPFCRNAKDKSDPQQLLQKRVEKNDPSAICMMGIRCYEEGNYVEAFEHYSKAAKMGDAIAHYQLFVMHRDGNGIESDKKKEVYHLEEAAIRGHPKARLGLGQFEGLNGRMERGLKHFIIAASLGDDQSMQLLKKWHTKDNINIMSDEQFAAALGAHQAAVDAMKSPQRDALEANYCPE